MPDERNVISIYYITFVKLQICVVIVFFSDKQIPLFHEEKMKIDFFKYQGTGNDFVIIDNRDNKIKRTDFKLFTRLCDRRFGIGADGVMLLQNKPEFDFEMVYYNADGAESTMCGNGGRCLSAFANFLGLVNREAHFLAVDGSHYAKISDKEISLQMKDINAIARGDDFFILNTGSPHYVKFVSKVKELDVFTAGREIRYSERFRAEGINVNFVEYLGDRLFVRTYERGVEDETLSCGTGVTASAICYSLLKNMPLGKQSINISSLGGDLNVSFHKTGEQDFSEVFLTGPATMVFQGHIEINV